MKRGLLDIVSLTVATLAVLTSRGAAAADSLEVGRLIERVACRNDTTQTYTLYLPTAFAADKRWPALLVFDPRGRSVSSAELFQAAAVHDRYPVDAHRIYAAGFSGGVLVAWYLAQFVQAPSLAGILGAGGRPAPEIPVETISFAHFGTAGNIDFNYSAMKLLDDLVEKRGAPHQLRIFEGRHQWMPPELAYEGVEWMEVLAMKTGLREQDAKLLDAIFAKELTRARELESAGQALELLRRYVVIQETWSGLRDIAAVRNKIATLSTDVAVVEQREEERRADEFELQTMERVSQLLGELESGNTAGSWRDYVDDLAIHELRRRAGQDSAMGIAAQRVLEWMFTRTAFYMSRDHLEHERYSAAAMVSRVALEIRPQAHRVWYSLACACVQNGDEKRAVDSLNRAIDNGFVSLAHLEGDPDLKPIRSSPGYAKAVERLK
jgi:dienelactone hydrolase